MLAAVSVGVAISSVSPPESSPEAASSSDDNGNFTTERRKGGTWSSANSGNSASGSGVRLERAGDSHFYANVHVGSATIRMMVDSGASVIALTRRDAEAMGVNVDDLPVAGIARTAGGDVPTRRLMLDSVAIDGLAVRRVEAAVIDADMGVSLLGQSYLAKLGKVNVEGDTMTLR